MKRYIEEFVSLNCAPDMLALKLFPNAKEITETMACFNAVRTHIIPKYGLEYRQKDVNVVVIGDGHKPRTGALFAMRTAWKVDSIDPLMDFDDNQVKRLRTWKSKIEDILYLGYGEEAAILVFPHSHARIDEMLRKIVAKTIHVISIPCCVPQEISGIMPDVVYKDENIWSEKNEVKIWLDIKRKEV